MMRYIPMTNSIPCHETQAGKPPEGKDCSSRDNTSTDTCRQGITRGKDVDMRLDKRNQNVTKFPSYVICTNGRER